MRLLAVAAATAALTLTPGGGAAGGDAIYANGDDLIGLRNLQGGTNTNPNFDIGAGSSVLRGDVSINWDIGRRLLVYDGNHHLLASFGPDGIWFFRSPHFCHSSRSHCNH